MAATSPPPPPSPSLAPSLSLDQVRRRDLRHGRHVLFQRRLRRRHRRRTRFGSVFLLGPHLVVRLGLPVPEVIERQAHRWAQNGDWTADQPVGVKSAGIGQRAPTNFEGPDCVLEKGVFALVLFVVAVCSWPLLCLLGESFPQQWCPFYELELLCGELPLLVESSLYCY